jgi:hypothetical protein
MRFHAQIVLFSVLATACVSRNARFKELDRAEFRRQDSSFVNQAVDQLLQSYTSLRSLPIMGVRPKEILVNRGDSTWVYQAVGTYFTYRNDRAPDACQPPSYASLVAWRELPSRIGIEAVGLIAAGDSAGMRDTFSTTRPDCGGRPVTLHHPHLGVHRIIGRQFREGSRPTGRGTVRIDVGREGRRPCPSKVKTWLQRERATAECRLTWMQVSFDTRLSAQDTVTGEPFRVSATVPAIHVWVDCRGTPRSAYLCPEMLPRPDTTARRAPEPPRRTPPALVTVAGVIKDPDEGVPIAYSRVRFENNRLVYADSNGRFTAQLKPGRATAMAECFNRGGGGYAGQSQDPFVVRQYMAELAFFLPFSRCMRPPGPVQDSVFQGLYDTGLERSRFTFCDNRSLNVWVEFSDQAVADRDRLLPRLKGKETLFYGFWWIVRGSLTGPGRFGRDSTADYHLKVEHVLDIRPRRSDECNR